MTAVSLYRALGSAGAWVSSPEGGRHATATSSGQQLPSDPARCPCRPLGPPATVTPGRLLVSPVSPQKGRTNWLLSPSATTRRPAPGGRWWLWWLWYGRLMRACLCRYERKSRSYSTGALDDQQLLAIEGSKKSRQGGHTTSKWTECEKPPSPPPPP